MFHYGQQCLLAALRPSFLFDDTLAIGIWFIVGDRFVACIIKVYAASVACLSFAFLQSSLLQASWTHDLAGRDAAAGVRDNERGCCMRSRRPHELALYSCLLIAVPPRRASCSSVREVLVTRVLISPFCSCSAAALLRPLLLLLPARGNSARALAGARRRLSRAACMLHCCSSSVLQECRVIWTFSKRRDIYEHSLTWHKHCNAAILLSIKFIKERARTARGWFLSGVPLPLWCNLTGYVSERDILVSFNSVSDLKSLFYLGVNKCFCDSNSLLLHWIIISRVPYPLASRVLILLLPVLYLSRSWDYAQSHMCRKINVKV
jgi:hypothetical protein